MSFWPEAAQAINFLVICVQTIPDTMSTFNHGVQKHFTPGMQLCDVMTHYLSSQLVFLLARMYGQEAAAVNSYDSRRTRRPMCAGCTPKCIWYPVKTMFLRLGPNWDPYVIPKCKQKIPTENWCDALCCTLAVTTLDDSLVISEFFLEFALSDWSFVPVNPRQLYFTILSLPTVLRRLSSLGNAKHQQNRPEDCGQSRSASESTDPCTLCTGQKGIWLIPPCLFTFHLHFCAKTLPFCPERCLLKVTNPNEGAFWKQRC